MGDHRAQGPGYRPGFNLYKREGSRFNGIVLILFINLSGCIPPRYRIQNKEMSGMPRDQITLAKSASAATPAMASSRAWWRRA